MRINKELLIIFSLVTILLVSCKGDDNILGAIFGGGDSGGEYTAEEVAILDAVKNGQNSGSGGGDTTPPTFAGISSAFTLTATSIRVNWAAATDDTSAFDEIFYDVYMSTTPGGHDFTAPPTASSAAGGGSATITVADANGTPYYFVVRARDAAGNSDSNTVEKNQVQSGGGDITPPTFGGLTQVTYINATTLVLTWDPATDNISYDFGIVYDIYMATSYGGQNFGAAPVATSAAGATSTIVNVASADSTNYFFVVRARDESGNSDSNTTNLTQTITDNTPPTLNGDPTATAAGNTQIILEWSNASDNVSGAAELTYEICQSFSSGGCNTFATTYTTTPGATSYFVTGLSAATDYYFKIRVKDSSSNTSGASNEVTATTDTSKVDMPQIATTTPNFNTTADVTITSETPSAIICYTTDNSDPVCDATPTCTTGSTYGGPFSIAATTTVKAIACKATLTDSNIASATYTLDTTPPTFAGVTGASGSGPIQLTWNPATDDVTAQSDIVYDIYVGWGNSCQNFATPDYTTSAGATSFSVNNINSTDPVFFVVRARDAAGNSDSNTVEKTASSFILYDNFDNGNCAWNPWYFKDGTKVFTVTMNLNDTVTSPVSGFNAVISANGATNQLGVYKTLTQFQPNYVSFYMRGAAYECTPNFRLLQNGAYPGGDADLTGNTTIKLVCPMAYGTGNFWLYTNDSANSYDTSIPCESTVWHKIELQNFQSGSFDLLIDGATAVAGASISTNAFDLVSLTGSTCYFGGLRSWWEEIIIY